MVDKKHFFRSRQFEVEWDGKIRGRGGAPTVTIVPSGVLDLDGTGFAEDGGKDEGRGRKH